MAPPTIDTGPRNPASIDTPDIMGGEDIRRRYEYPDEDAQADAISFLESSGMRLAVNIAMLALGLGTLACALIVLGLRMNDAYLIDHVAGSWMALAQWANAGVLYPEFWNGEVYGGTRNMPIPILLHSLVADVTGEYLMSGKIISGVSCLLIALMIYLAAGLSHLSLPMRVGLCSVFMLTGAVTLVYSGIRNDALPVALQLAALLLVERQRNTLFITVAGILCAIAMMAKLTALWGPAAIGMYLLLNDWRRLLLFIPAVLVPYFAGMTLVNEISDGRMLTNLFGVALAGQQSIGEIIGHMVRFVDDMNNSALLIWIVFGPIALIEILRAIFDYRMLPRHWALVFSLILTMVVYTDVGVFSNHLIDLTALTTIVVAAFLGRSGQALRVVASIAILWVAATAVLLDRTIVLAAARAATGEKFERDPFSDWVAPDQTLLSQDPYVPVILGRQPEVMDAFMFRRVAESNPAFDDPLIAKIEAQAYDRIILMLPIHDTPKDRLMRTVHFGEPVWEAIMANYQHIGETGLRHHVYAPITPTEPEAEPTAQ